MKAKLIILFLLLLLIPYRAEAFRDVTPEISEAAEEFTQEGLFGSFIYKYGNDLFRPDGYVTRESLIMVLKEYHMLTTRLISQNRKMAAEINSLKKKAISTENMDLVLREFQKVLDPMLKNSEVIKSLARNTSSVPAAAAAPADGEIDSLKSRIEGLETRIADLTPAEAEREQGKSRSYEKPVNNYKEELNKIEKEVTMLQEDLFKQKKHLYRLMKDSEDEAAGTELKNVKMDISRLEKKVDDIAYAGGARNSGYSETAASSGRGSSGRYDSDEIKDLNRDISALRSGLKDINRKLDEQKKDLDNIPRGAGSGSAVISSIGNIAPFWAKVSIGFSAVALFFMAR